MLVLRKTIPKTIKDLTIYELVNILYQILTKNTVVYSSQEYLSRIKLIEADNYENIDLNDKQTIRHCQRMLSVAIEYGLVTENFRINFIKCLRNAQILVRNIRFVQLSFDNLVFWIYGNHPNHKSILFVGDGLYKILYYNSPDRIYQQHREHWISEGYAASDDVEYYLNIYQRSISILKIIFYMIVINRLDLNDDIKQYLKRFFEIPKDIMLK